MRRLLIAALLALPATAQAACPSQPRWIAWPRR